MIEETTETRVRRAFKEIIAREKPEILAPGYDAPDAVILGILVSKFTEWDIPEIFDVFMSALEDANAPHDIAAQVEEAREDLMERLNG